MPATHATPAGHATPHPPQFAVLVLMSTHTLDVVEEVCDRVLVMGKGKLVADGTVADDIDPEAVLYFVRTLNLGLLLQRAAGLTPPDPTTWRQLVDRIVASFGDQTSTPGVT